MVEQPRRVEEENSVDWVGHGNIRLQAVAETGDS